MTKPSHRASALVVVATLLTLGLWGCSDSGSPETFDPVASNQVASEVMATFVDNPAIDALFVLETALPWVAGAAAAPPAPAIDSPYPAFDNARVLDRLLGFLSPASPAVLFPADLLGTTLVYNPATGQYEVDPAATGAPTNGVRIVLYAVDPIFLEPVEPLNAIGYLDLTDEGTVSADRAGVVVVIGNVTYLDYIASATVFTTSLEFDATGYLSDGVTVVDFALTHTWSEAEGFTLEYAIDVVEDDVSLDVLVVLDPTAESATLGLEVRHGTEMLAFDLTATATELAGSVTANGSVVVTVSGTPDAPVFDADGLSAEQQQALGELIEGIFAVVEGFNALLIPAYLVLQVSLATV
jgi:hypothetical protein